MGRDYQLLEFCILFKRFQSTLPAWGETALIYAGCNQHTISIHSPRMGRDQRMDTSIREIANFNPLSPHGERLDFDYKEGNDAEFQSTLPAWGETM